MEGVLPLPLLLDGEGGSHYVHPLRHCRVELYLVINNGEELKEFGALDLRLNARFESFVPLIEVDLPCWRTRFRYWRG